MTDLIYHLSAEAKAKELKIWKDKCAGPRGAPGEGFPDERIIPFCTIINALPGVCTLQSCAGHPRTSEQHWSAPGQLWLWFSEWEFNLFTKQAPILAENPQIESIKILFARWNDRRVVVDICFKGDETGDEELQQSIDILFQFIGDL